MIEEGMPSNFYGIGGKNNASLEAIEGVEKSLGKQ